MIRKEAFSELCEHIGQLLIIGFDGTEMSPGLRSLLTRTQPAGVILFARNIATAQQTHKLLKDCRTCVTTPIFTCVDMEGGRVDRFRNVIGPAPSAADVFGSDNRKLFRKHGKIIGESCRALGFNVDFAPVVDLALKTSRAVLSSRAVSADPWQVIVYAREFLAGLRSAEVIGAAKHFPGLGEANLDTHHELPRVKKSFQRLWSEDLIPYRTMRRELPIVLIGHANYAAVTRDGLPASLSKKWIRQILRGKIGYRRLIVSDDLEMGGVLKAGPIEQVAAQHIRAGGDLCLICQQEDGIVRSYEALIHEAQRDRKFAERVRESVARVLAFKKKSAQLRRVASPPPTHKIEKLSRALWEFGEQVRIEAIKQQNSDRGAEA